MELDIRSRRRLGDLPMATPSRVAVYEKQIEVDGEGKWLYAAINIESKLLPKVAYITGSESIQELRSCID